MASKSRMDHGALATRKRNAPEKAARAKPPPVVRGAKIAEPIAIFASYSHEYQDLAREFKRSIETLQSAIPVNVFVSEQMAGGTKWRSQIRSELNQAKLFILLYPHTRMRLEWCSYELGLFHQREERPVVCIRNTNIKSPPDITDEWQDYIADADGIRKFLVELFVKGTFTSRMPICAEAGVFHSEAHKRLEQAVENLNRGFERARVRLDYYTKRICIESGEKPAHPFDLESDLDKAMITGEEVALRLLRVQTNAKWTALLKELAAQRPAATWPGELANAFTSIKSGPIPPPFTPFRADDGKIYFPVISRVDSVDQKIRKVYLIFVEANPSKMQSLLDIWIPTGDTAAFWTPLIRSMLTVLRMRWKFIVPIFYNARDIGTDEEAAKALLEEATRAINTLEDELGERIVHLMDIYSDIDDAMRHEGEAVEDEYRLIKCDMQAAKAPLAKSVPGLVERWIANNTRQARFLAKLFTLRAERLYKVKTTRNEA